MRLNARLAPLKAAVIQACLPAVERVLAEQKMASGAYDFDEIIAGVVRAMDGPAGARLIRLLRERATGMP